MTATLDPKVVKRQKVERTICSVLIREAVKAGYRLSVYNGEEFVTGQTTDRLELLKAMFSVDEEHLYFYKDWKRVGWVFLVYGNDGWDAINDYTTNLDHLFVEGGRLNKTIERAELTMCG